MLTPDYIKNLVRETYQQGDFEIYEAEYKGKKVRLNKPFRTPGGPRNTFQLEENHLEQDTIVITLDQKTKLSIGPVERGRRK